MQDNHQIIGVYLDPTTQRVSSSLLQTVEIEARQVAAILVTVVDCIIDKIPEAHQTSFEQTVLFCFNSWVKQRHEMINIKSHKDNRE